MSALLLLLVGVSSEFDIVIEYGRGGRPDEGKLFQFDHFYLSQNEFRRRDQEAAVDQADLG